MDIKIGGITHQIMAEALAQAREGRLFILRSMTDAISVPRQDISAYAPGSSRFRSPRKKIGGRDRDGARSSAASSSRPGSRSTSRTTAKSTSPRPTRNAAQKAIRMIEDLVMEAEVGKTYLGTVTRLVDFGAFVRYSRGRKGCCTFRKWPITACRTSTANSK